MGTVAFIWGLVVILAMAGNVANTTGFIMMGLGLVCFSISSKVILLAKVWKQSFSQPDSVDSGTDCFVVFVFSCLSV